MNPIYILCWSVVGIIYIVASLIAEYDAWNNRNFRNSFTKHAYIISVSLFMAVFMALTVGSIIAYVINDIVEIASKIF